MCNVEHMYMQAQSQMPALISFRRFSNPPPLQKKKRFEPLREGARGSYGKAARQLVGI